MTIPLATTTVTIEATAEAEPYEGKTRTARATGVPAHISAPSGSERLSAGSAERIDAVLLVDTQTLAQTDRVTDDTTGAVYRLAWVTDRRGLGLDHMRAGLVAVTGKVPA